MKPYYRRILCASLFSLSFAVFSFAQAADKTVLRVGYLPILDHLPLLISHAHDNAAFAQVDSVPKQFKSWEEMIGALRAGVIDAAFILSPMALDLFTRGLDIRAVLLAHRDGAAITVKKDSGIRTAADLKGKKIAIPARTATHTALLNHFLSSAGLSLNDVYPKVIAPPHMLLAMKHERIDAFIVAEPFGSKAQHSGMGEILVLTRDIMPNHVECIVVVKHDMLQQHANAIQEWLGSLVRAGRFIDDDKINNQAREVARLTAGSYLPHDTDSIMMGLGNPSDRISFSDLNPVKEDFQIIVDISKQAGILQDANLDAFIEPRFYNALAVSVEE
jgi:NitT/TauT family transport system substrate-binding protein